MKAAFRSSFARDLKRIRDRQVRTKIAKLIKEVEAADSLQQISGLKKLSGADQFYRIRIGDFRIGLFIDFECIEFVRCLHRRDVYRFFP